MGFVGSVKSGFQNALQFSGRSRRPDYWWFFLFVFAGALVIGALEALVFGMPRPRFGLVTVFQLIVFLPFLAVGWRRLQDTGRPGWYLLIPSAIVVLSAIVTGSMMARMTTGVMGPGGMSGPDAMVMGAQGALAAILWLAQLIAGVVIIWWMTRPSQRGVNSYGPEPRVR